MFTGLVEELGQIHSLTRGARSARVVIRAQVVMEGIKLGDSIAVNGVCLTVTEFTSHTFGVDVMHETLKRSNLGKLHPNDWVNLERALRIGDRLGGHLVSGHIDGIGTIVREEKQDIARILEISAPPAVLCYALEKGSIAIDGISLTLVGVSERSFTISLIPHTASLTTLGYKKVGDTVNLEADMIGKYVEKLLGHKGPNKGWENQAPLAAGANPGTTGTTVAGGGLTLEFLVDKGII